MPEHKPPIIAISMGDPAGVGPEVTVQALALANVWQGCRPLTVGAVGVLAKAAALLGTGQTFHVISDPAQARFDPRSPDVLDVPAPDVTGVVPGQVSALAGQASVNYVERAVQLVQQGHAHAVTTGPINKTALKAAGIPHIGHTELLGELLGEPEVTTMLATTGLRVVHVTRHVGLGQVAERITLKNVLATTRLTDSGLRQMGISNPRIAVAALNPHGGDNGLMGDEELVAIGPAVEAARAEGINATGPIPADSVFFRAIRGEFDVVVAMYHDQGHIPIKTHGFERSVTVTLGLPIVRTSVDHGTAFDIAWKGIASPESMVEALGLAAQLAIGAQTLQAE
jgi:4-hydroxythreonine-4-phosphate dehydrogenase